MQIAADPRGKKGVKNWLEREKKKYNKLCREEREFFYKERLTNPYADTRIHYGDPAKSFKTVFIGVDIEAGEIALIKALNKNTDLIINHHPKGKVLRKVPKYKIASLNNAGPRFFGGVSENRTGQFVALDITGGTEGAKNFIPNSSKRAWARLLACI